MNLLHIFPSFQTGGSQRRFAALANHFGDLFKHTVISLDGCFDAEKLLLPSVSFKKIASPPKASLVPAIIRAQRVLNALKPDLLITYNWGAIEWAAANLTSAVRHVHIEDGFGPEEAQAQLQRRVLFRRLVLNHHSQIVLPSQTLVSVATNTWHIAPDRISYVPNGIPCKNFNRNSEDKECAQFRGDGPIIGTVATLRKEKALDRLIGAFKTIRNDRPARLVIVGDGPERDNLERLVATSGLSGSITFTGNLTQPERAIEHFDIFAISSDTEQMPLSVLEGMAAGLPIVSTNVGDVRYMVAAQNHPFIVDRDESALTGAMRQLLNNAPLGHSIGHFNRIRATAEFDETKMFTSYKAVFSGHA